DLDLASLARAATELQAAGRAWSTLELLMLAKHEKRPLTHTLVCVALEALEANPSERTPATMDAYYIHEAFEFLHSCQDVAEDRVARLEFGFLPFLDRHSRLPRTLQRQLSRNPDFFIACLKLLFRPRSEVQGDVDVDDDAVVDPKLADKASRIWHLLHDWRIIPGTLDDGTVSVDALRSWILKARQDAREAGRLGVCDVTLGELFAHSPEDADKAKPALAIREIIEECESIELERGFAIGLHNLRGCYSKGLYDGGKQERDFSSKFSQYAAICVKWPRTAGVFRQVAEDYLKQAEREDAEARVRD
ncbi:MAG: hypothetical protein ABL962_14580, partial [Fimbriimonadaceae bacterium]